MNLNRISLAERTRRIRNYLAQISPERQLENAKSHLEASVGAASGDSEVDVKRSGDSGDEESMAMEPLDVLIRGILTKSRRIASTALKRLFIRLSDLQSILSTTLSDRLLLRVVTIGWATRNDGSEKSFHRFGALNHRTIYEVVPTAEQGSLSASA